MPTTDVVIIKPGSQKKLYANLSDFQLTAIEPPLWGALLAGFLRDKGYAVELLDAEVEQWSYEEAARQIADRAALLAVVSVSGSNPSASTMNMIGAGEILRFHAELAPDQPRLIMGLHPSAMPERTMQDEQVDFLCQGEGFYTLPPLLEALKSGDDRRDIPGLWYRDQGRIVSNPRPPVWEDLDTLPPPAWDMLPMTRYRAHNWHCFGDIGDRSPYGVIYTSLGCPFQCTFCCINSLFGGKHRIRYRDPDLVIDEIGSMVETYGIRNFKLIDEMFVLKRDHVRRFCDNIIRRGYDLNIWAYARVNTVNRELLAKMKRAGIHWVAYGFESGSKRVLEDVTKGYELEKVMDVVRMTYDEGLHICANFIFGLPEDDFDSMQETLNLATEINAEWANLYSTMAYPGSALYEQAVKDNLPLPDCWEGYSQYSYECRPLPTKHLSGGQVLSFRDYAFDAYHRNPRYLDMLDRKFGPRAAEYMRQITKHSLKRKYAE